MIPRRRVLAGLAGGLAMPAVARAQQGMRWRMVTSWTKNLPGPGVSARRIAERITALSEGRLTVEPFAAGEIVPAFAVLEAVSTGVAEAGHSASLFWEGKSAGSALFTTAPFGMGPLEHQTWIAERGGQALWDELYEPFGVRAMLASNTGPSMAGWFRQEIASADQVRGLRIRVQGLGGEVYKELGATPMAIPPGDVAIALERGAIDAVELLAPANDLPLGFNRFAPVYHMPGFNKPNGAAELIVSRKAWEVLPADLRAIVETVCAAEHGVSLAEAERSNAQALAQLVGIGVKVVPLPGDALVAARKAADGVLDATAARSPLAGRIVASYREAAAAGRAWSRVEAYMAQAIRGPA
jgi:TRAP-type mannitol/chloroaromatic compound transport system substrate-binding protein